jgi:hypothetical protein
VIGALAMAFSLTVGGLDVIAANYLHVAAGAVTHDSTLQARGLFRFTLKDRTGTYRPALHAEVIAELDGVRIFGGNLTTVDEQDWGDYKGIWCPCEAADFGAALDTMPYNGILTGTTLRALVSQLVTERLAPLGYTVHPLMAEGPAIGPAGFGFGYITDILDTLGTMARWPWMVTHYKQILFAEPGLAGGPFALTATNETINTIKVHHDLVDYANVVWIHFGATGPREVTDTWHGDSSTKLFPVTFPQPEGVISQPPTVLINCVTKPVANWGVDSGYDWYWRGSDAALIQDFGIPTLTPADTLIATYVANFPGAVVAVDAPGRAAYGERAIIEAQPTVFDVDQARQIAAGRLVERGGPLRKVDVVTHRPGLAVGQNIPVTVPERNLDEPCLVLSVQMSLDGVKAEDTEEYWKFTVGLVEGAQYFETWQKFWRVSQDTGSAQSGSGTVGPPPATGGGGSGGGSSRPSPIYFGGEREAWLSGAGWQPIPGFVDVLLDPAAWPQIVLRCQSWVLAAGMTITVRLVSLSGVQVGIGAAVSDTSATAAGAFQEFTATLLGTPQYYRLEATVTGTSAEGAVAGGVGYPVTAAMRRARPPKVA